MKHTLILTSLLLSFTVIAGATDVSVTVYNDNLALVRDVRDVVYERGRSEIRFTDVSGQIDATSVHFAADGVSLLEQNFDYDLVSPDKLTYKYIDREIEVIGENGELSSGTLLTASTGGSSGYIVLRRRDGSLRNMLLKSITEIRYPELPEGLITRPTLKWLVDTESAGSKRTEVSYLTGGLSWRADYVLVTSDDDVPADLSAWVTINNTCGTSYQDAKLKLMAGDVNRVRDYGKQRVKVPTAHFLMETDAGAGFEEKSFFEYHLYTLQRPTDLLDQQTKQVSLFPNTSVRTKRIYEYDWRRRNDRVGVSLEFANTEENGLGIPLPAGRFRIYQRDDDGSQEFVGEDNIDHTPKKEDLRVRVGDAFDIVPERSEKDYRRITQQVMERDYEVKIRNRKEEAVTVVVVDHVYGDWTVMQASHEHRKVSARKIEFDLDVAADQEVVLTYTVRYR